MDENYCRSHLLQPNAYYYNILPDVFDTMAMDFLIGNADRHHFETYALHGIKEGRLMHIDNGKRCVRNLYIVYSVCCGHDVHMYMYMYCMCVRVFFLCSFLSLPLFTCMSACTWVLELYVIWYINSSPVLVIHIMMRCLY